jgi:hypothetical protein
MIDKEQAIIFINASIGTYNNEWNKEYRIVSLEPCDMNEQFPEHMSEEDYPAGQLDLLKDGWKCVYQYKWHNDASGEDEWDELTCYAVEPEPGPYVVF